MLIAITLYVCWIDNKSWNLIYASSLYLCYFYANLLYGWYQNSINQMYTQTYCYQHNAENVVIGQ